MSFRVHYTLDNAGNRLKGDTLDAGDTLARAFNTIGQLTALKDAGKHATGFTLQISFPGVKLERPRGCLGRELSSFTSGVVRKYL